jgi:energy-coupling factor transporter ATP-binding protein EcfA2
MDASINLSSLRVSYGPDVPRALTDITISIPHGNVCAVLGPTGAGKTTLLYAVSGLLGGHAHALETGGSISLLSETFSPFPRQALFPHLMMLLQEPHLQLSGMAQTVEEEVSWTLENMGLSAADAEVRTTRILHRLRIDHLRGRNLRTLSGGELHRVALASVLVAEPLVLLLDEPASSLDQNARQMLLGIISSLKRRTTVLLTDTDPDLAFRVADQIVVLERGCIVFDGSRHAFRARLSDFTHLLPIDDWTRASSSLSHLPKSALKRRLTTLIEGT